MPLNINHLRDREVFLHILGRVNILFEATRRFIFIWKGGEVFPTMTHMGRLRPVDGPIPGFSFFKGLRNLSVCYSKVGLKGAQIFWWKVYEKDASSTVVTVSKGSDLNGNLMILNFLEHPRFWYRREQFPGGIASLPLFSSNILHCRCSQTLRKLLYTIKN